MNEINVFLWGCVIFILLLPLCFFLKKLETTMGQLYNPKRVRKKQEPLQPMHHEDMLKMEMQYYNNKKIIIIICTSWGLGYTQHPHSFKPNPIYYPLYYVLRNKKQKIIIINK